MALPPRQLIHIIVDTKWHKIIRVLSSKKAAEKIIKENPGFCHDWIIESWQINKN